MRHMALLVGLTACSDSSLKTFNSSPTATINSHADGDSIVESPTTTVFGKVSDSDHPAADLEATWYVDGEAICEDQTPEEDGSTLCEVELDPGTFNIVLEVSDPKNASGNDSIEVTVAATLPPEVNLVSPYDEDRHRAGESIEFRGSAYDAEDGIGVSVWLESDIQGVLDIAPTLDAEGQFSTFGTLEEGEHIITLWAEDSSGKRGEDNHRVEVVKANGPPTIETVEVAPDPATTEDALTCEASGVSDPDEDAVTVTYAWTVNADPAGTGTALSDAFVRGDGVACTAIPNDGELDGDPVSDSIIIGNAKPRIETVAIVPSPATVLDELSCGYTGFSDADGDADGSTVSWTVNGVDAGTGPTLSAGYGRGDDVVCTVTPFDGLDEGDAMSDSIVIGNAVPELVDVVLSPTEVYTNDVLSLSVSEFDADGDAITVTSEWFVNGVSVGETGLTLNGVDYFDKHDDVHAVVTPHDGTDLGAPVTSDTVTVLNSPPTAPVIGIADGSCPSGWTAMADGERCVRVHSSATHSWEDADAACGDLDGDLVSILSEADNDLVLGLSAVLGEESTWIGFTDRSIEGSWEWQGGEPVTYVNWSELEPSATGAENCGEMYHHGGIAVEPGTWNDNPCASPGHSGGYACQIYSGSGLQCTIDEHSTDADGDPIAYRFEWEVDGVGYTDTDTLEYEGDAIPMDALAVDGEWTCTVTPNDSDEDGDSASASVSHVAETVEPGDCTSLYMDGDDDVVVPASTDFVEAERQLTIESWVKWDGHSGQPWYPVATQGWGDSTEARFFLAVSGTEGSDCSGVSGAGFLHLEIHTSFSTGICLSSVSTLTPGRWHHVSAVFESGEARIYIDGVRENTGSRDDETLHTATPSEVKIGRVDVGLIHRFKGSMSNVRYSSIARYSDDFSPQWPLGSDSDTLGLWLLDDGSSTATDESGNGNDGAVTGGSVVEACPDADADGYTVIDDCDDADDTVHPLAGDTTTDDVDTDCDGLDCNAAFSGDTYFVACFAEETWSESHELCQDAGHDGLATILSDGENNDATALMIYDESPSSNDLYWMGYNDQSSEGSYLWISGLTGGYTNWAPMEPSDGGGREDCGHIYSYAFDLGALWNDHFCETLQSYVCESRG